MRQARNCTAIVSSVCTCILPTLGAALSPIPLTPLLSTNPLLKPGHKQLYPRTLSLLLCHAPAKPRKQQHIHEPVCRESERGGMDGGAGLNGGSGRWRAEEGGILWEGSQSNYRQRCSPGFFGGTKFTFQRSLPPSPRTFLLLPLSLPLPASPFLISSHRGSHSHLPPKPSIPPPKKHHTPSPPFAHPSIYRFCLKRGEGIELYRQRKHLVTRIAMSCSDVKKACSATQLCRSLSAFCREAAARARQVSLTPRPSL